MADPTWDWVKPEKSRLHDQVEDVVQLLGKAVAEKRKEIEDLRESLNGNT